MRRAMTLIELIFAMVIVAVVFMVIPRILFVANKSHQLGMKEELIRGKISSSLPRSAPEFFTLLLST